MADMDPQPPDPNPPPPRRHKKPSKVISGAEKRRRRNAILVQEQQQQELQALQVLQEQQQQEALEAQLAVQEQQQQELQALQALQEQQQQEALEAQLAVQEQQQQELQALQALQEQQQQEALEALQVLQEQQQQVFLDAQLAVQAQQPPVLMVNGGFHIGHHYQCCYCNQVEDTANLVRPCVCPLLWHYQCLCRRIVDTNDARHYGCNDLMNDGRIVRDPRDQFWRFLVHRPDLMAVSTVMATLMGWSSYLMSTTTQLMGAILQGQLSHIPTLLLYLVPYVTILGAVMIYSAQVMPQYNEWAENQRIVYLHDFDGINEIPGAVTTIRRGLMLNGPQQGVQKAPAIQAMEDEFAEPEDIEKN